MVWRVWTLTINIKRRKFLMAKIQTRKAGIKVSSGGPPLGSLSAGFAERVWDKDGGRHMGMREKIGVSSASLARLWSLGSG